VGFGVFVGMGVSVGGTTVAVAAAPGLSIADDATGSAAQPAVKANSSANTASRVTKLRLNIRSSCSSILDNEYPILLDFYANPRWNKPLYLTTVTERSRVQMVRLPWTIAQVVL